MPTFREVGDKLRDRFEGAAKVGIQCFFFKFFVIIYLAMYHQVNFLLVGLYSVQI